MKRREREPLTLGIGTSPAYSEPTAGYEPKEPLSRRDRRREWFREAVTSVIGTVVGFAMLAALIGGIVLLANLSDESGSASSRCHPSCEGACLDPDAYDYDCEGGSGDGPEYTGEVEVVGSDDYGLDHDGDGVACQSGY